MTVPTPLNDQTRDDRFDHGFERLLDGDPRGIDKIEPELRDISLHMVSLANEAGWIGSDRGKSADRSRFRNARTIINAVAAVVVIGVIGSMIMLGMQVWGPGEGQYGSGPDSGPVDLGRIEVTTGVCERTPRTDFEIAAIVRSDQSAVYPFQFKSAGFVGDPRSNTLQLVRDWNACLIDQDWTRAMAYESEYFIWLIGQEQFPDGVGSLTDAQIASQIVDQHSLIEPIRIANGLSFYSAENHRVQNNEEGFGIIGLDGWIVGLDDNGDWIQWPAIVTVEWDGSRMVIVSSTQSGVPESEFQRNDAVPATPDVESP